MVPVIDAILFDLDDTLLDGNAAWRCGMEALLARCPEVERALALDAWNDVFEEYFPQYLSGELTFEESRIARIRAWSEAVSVVVTPGEELSWFDLYLGGYESGWVAFADVSSTLDALNGFRLGVITNGDGDQQRAKLHTLGLQEAFEVVICSGDVGYAKPDRRIFTSAATRLALPPERCLYIGDRRDTDALGALEAGMSSLWLNRKGVPAPDGRVRQITTLEGLLALVSEPTAR
jgi:putative hydrolase of the HAD superfamily